MCGMEASVGNREMMVRMYLSAASGLSCAGTRAGYPADSGRFAADGPWLNPSRLREFAMDFGHALDLALGRKALVKNFESRTVS